jgi:serine O-acetyltransferase
MSESLPDTASAEVEDLSSVVDALCRSNGREARASWNACDTPLPSRDAVIQMIEQLRSVLFPGYFGNSEISPDSMHFHVGATLDRVLSVMQEQVKRGLCFDCHYETAACRTCDDRALRITRRFLARLPRIQHQLDADVRAHYEGDPAALNPDEAVFCYPGVLALISHRLAHELYRLGVPLIPRMINEHAHSLTGIDIHPGATIGDGLFIDHGTGVVIGETSIIGDRVRIYQGVTLGAKSFPLDADGNPIKSIPRHPIVEDDVILYSGATILGRVTLGAGSMIGGNVWLVRSVPPGSRIIQSPAREEEFAGGAGI